MKYYFDKFSGCSVSNLFLFSNRILCWILSIILLSIFFDKFDAILHRLSMRPDSEKWIKMSKYFYWIWLLFDYWNMENGYGKNIKNWIFSWIFYFGCPCHLLTHSTTMEDIFLGIRDLLHLYEFSTFLCVLIDRKNNLNGGEWVKLKISKKVKTVCRRIGKIKKKCVNKQKTVKCLVASNKDFGIKFHFFFFLTPFLHKFYTFHWKFYFSHSVTFAHFSLYCLVLVQPQSLTQRNKRIIKKSVWLQKFIGLAKSALLNLTTIFLLLLSQLNLSIFCLFLTINFNSFELNIMQYFCPCISVEH